MEMITDSELMILELLWEHKGMEASKIVKEMQKRVSLSSNTIYTVITRGVKKGIFRREDPHFMCFANVEKAEIQNNELNHLYDKLFNNDSYSLISALLKNDKRINKKELEAIKQMIESYEND